MSNQNKGLLVPFMAITTLFFAWGAITQLVDPLVASVRAIFSLSYTEALLTQFAYFLAYGVISLPGAAMVARVGYGRSIVIALVTMIVGCLIIPLATSLGTYEGVLIALFIIASGVTVLQVAANPLASALGPQDKSHLRLLAAQTFNSLGTVVAPYVGSVILLTGGIFAASDATIDDATRRAASLRSIDTAFFIIVGMLALLTVLVVTFRRRMEAVAPILTQGPSTPVLSALTSRWAVLGAVAIFLYVGAEVSIGSILINFLHQKDVFDFTLEKAGKYLSFYWGGAFVGRILGSIVLFRASAWRMLTLFSAIAAVLCLTVSQTSGDVSGYAALAIGLFNSIMFPVIFTLTLERSTASPAATSGLLCMAIVGGAILPLLVGLVGDSVGLHASFLVPMVAYAAITVFAMAAGRARVVVRDQAPAVAH